MNSVRAPGSQKKTDHNNQNNLRTRMIKFRNEQLNYIYTRNEYYTN